jgi:hypothetical protein
VNCWAQQFSYLFIAAVLRHLGNLRNKQLNAIANKEYNDSIAFATKGQIYSHALTVCESVYSEI